MKCANKYCNNDVMAAATPLFTMIHGESTCSEACRQAYLLQNIHQEESEYFKKCKGLPLDDDSKVKRYDK